MINAEHTDQHMNNVTHKPQKIVYEWEEQPIISKEHHRSSGYQAPTTDRKRQKSQRLSAGEHWITIATNPAGDQPSRGQEKPGARPPPWHQHASLRTGLLFTWEAWAPTDKSLCGLK